MITKFKLYEAKLTDDIILSISAEEIINNYLRDWSGFSTKEDAIDEIDYILSEDFPEGFKNIPKTVTLFRVLLLEDGQKVNEDEIGEHFVAVGYHTYNQGFLEKIGVWDNWNEDNELWLLTCITDKTNIDLETTIGNRLLYPREYEFTLHNGKNVKVIDKKIINKKQVSI